jgi:hydroxymethylbilane synthase
MSQHTLIVGTRGSALALWQTKQVGQRLGAIHPELDVVVKTIQTRGDVVRDRALSQVGGKGLFVKEIEQALLAGEIDLAVHSLKDMPTEQPDSLALGAILERADPRDALVVRDGGDGLSGLASGARVGTSSLRRRAQLLAVRPDLEVLDLRGNVDTRLRKLGEGRYEAVVLAAAGLARLGHAEAITQFLPVETMLPAVGQGALCIEVRSDDKATRGLISMLDHMPTRQATEAERAFLHRLEGG